MRISGSIHYASSWPLRRALPGLRDAGYDAVELSWTQVEREFANARDPVAGLRALLAEHGLTLSGMNVADMTAVDESELCEVVSVIRRQMGFARKLGLTAVNLKGGDRRRQSLVMLSAGLDAILREADVLDMTIGLGNACGNRIEQIEDLRWVFLETGHPRLGVLNDTGAFHSAAVNPRDVIREFGDRTSLMRISDRVGKRPVALGEGEMNVPTVIEHARRIGYDGWLVIGADMADVNDALRYLTHARVYLQALLRNGT